MLKDYSVRISKLSKSVPIIISIIAVAVIIPALLPVSALCNSISDEDKKAPLHVLSDRMIAKRDTSMVEFIGDVKATWQDSVLLSDSVQVYFNEQSDKKDDSPQSNIKKIISTGNVRYTSGERKAFADKAVYTAHDDILVLTGESPKLVTGSSFITGKKITLFRQQDKVIVESDGSNRVEALFNPEDDFDEKQ
jgi:lipopolysaccharide export system protein LptA